MPRCARAHPPAAPTVPAVPAVSLPRGCVGGRAQVASGRRGGASILRLPVHQRPGSRWPDGRRGSGACHRHAPAVHCACGAGARCGVAGAQCKAACDSACCGSPACTRNEWQTSHPSPVCPSAPAAACRRARCCALCTRAAATWAEPPPTRLKRAAAPAGMLSAHADAITGALHELSSALGALPFSFPPPPTLATLRRYRGGVVPAAAALAAALWAYWHEPEQLAAGRLAAAQAVAVRACAYTRCAYLGGEGGARAGTGAGSRRCR